MFANLGRAVVGHPWRVIGAWVVAAIAIIGIAPKLSTTANEASFLPSHYQSVQAQDLQKRAFPHAAAPAALVVFERAGGQPLSGADRAHIAATAAVLGADHIPTVSAVGAPIMSSNGLVATVPVQMPNAQGQLSTAQTDAVGTLRTDVARAVAGTDLRAGVTGTAAQTVDQAKTGKKANSVVALATIVLIVMLLLLIFRSPVIALLPVLVIGVVSQMATGLIASLSHAFGLQVDNTVTAMLIVVLFGVGTDYILFLLFRYRERLRAGEDPKAAMVSAVGRVGPAIATAAGAVIIAFLALTLSSLSLFRSLGPALAVAVATTLIAGLTVVPAIVSLLGARIFWPSKAWQAEPSGTHFRSIGDSLGRHPARFAGAAGLVLVALGIAGLDFHPTFDLNSGSQTSTQSAVYDKVLQKGFAAGATQPTDVFVQSHTGGPLSVAELASYGHRLAGVRGVSQVAPPKIGANGTVADYRLILVPPGKSNAAMDIVRGPLQQVADSPPPGTHVLIGGISSVFVDLQKAMDRDYAVVFPVAAILILVILGLLLQSVVAPWYLMVAVGLGFAGTLGAAVLVFQIAGSASGLTFILPIVMYLFVVALGTDYNILMISRLREEATEGLEPRAAAAMAVRHAGPTIGAAGLILAGTFASLMLAGGSTLTQMGFAISFGIAVAAFVMALFLTPGLTAVIGHAAWWPGHDPHDPHHVAAMDGVDRPSAGAPVGVGVGTAPDDRATSHIGGQSRLPRA